MGGRGGDRDETTKTGTVESIPNGGIDVVVSFGLYFPENRCLRF